MVARTRPEAGLWITFTRGNDTIDHNKQWAKDGVEANKLTLKMLLETDELAAGDRICITAGAANSNIPAKVR